MCVCLFSCANGRILSLYKRLSVVIGDDSPSRSACSGLIQNRDLFLLIDGVFFGVLLTVMRTAVNHIINGHFLSF